MAAQKMREMGESERKGKNGGELKASRQKEALLMKEIKNGVLYSACLGAFIANPSYKIQKKKTKTKTKVITGDKTGRKPKSDKGKSKSQKAG